MIVPAVIRSQEVPDPTQPDTQMAHQQFDAHGSFAEFSLHMSSDLAKDFGDHTSGELPQDYSFL